MFVYFVSQQDSGGQKTEKDIECLKKKVIIPPKQLVLCISPRKVDIQMDIKQPLRPLRQEAVAVFSTATWWLPVVN